MLDELYPLYKILDDAFPGHRLSEHQYWHIIVLLYPEMSDRQLAKVMSQFTGRDYYMIYNDIAKAAALDYADDEEFKATKENLERCGYFKYISQDCFPINETS